jgi:hypothetical protein
MPLIVRGQMYGCLDLTDEWGAGLIKRRGGLEMSMEGLDAE